MKISYVHRKILQFSIDDSKLFFLQIDLKRSNNEIGSDDSDESANDMETSDCDNDIDDDDEPPLKLRRSQYTLDVLQSWYDSKFANESSDSKPQLAIIMPNFEEFKPSIIKDLILILRLVNHFELMMIERNENC